MNKCNSGPWLVLFLSWTSLLRPCTTKPIRNRSIALLRHLPYPAQRWHLLQRAYQRRRSKLAIWATTVFYCHCEVIRLGCGVYEYTIRVLYSHEDPTDRSAGSWISAQFFRQDGKRSCNRDSRQNPAAETEADR